MAAGASVCYALQFVCMKFYQRRVGNNLFTSLVFGVISTAINAALIFAVKAAAGEGFAVGATPFTLTVAAALALVSALIVIVGIAVMKRGKLSVYSNFMMLGGMALPFVFGLWFMDESMSVWKGVGMAVMALSLLVSMGEKKSEETEKKSGWVFYLLCFFVFALNGGTSILSAVQANASVFHQSATGLYDFIIWTRLFTVAISAVMVGVGAAAAGKRRKAELLTVKDIFGAKAMIALVAYSVVSLLGFVLSMNCMGEGKLDSSSLYPITTGGTIVLSAVFGRAIFKEKITRYMAVCLILTMAATVAFMF